MGEFCRRIFISATLTSFLLVCFRAGSLDAAKMQIVPGVEGFWQDSARQEKSEVNWQAQWIWMSEEIESDVMLARRSFTLPERPERARLHVTATSQYQLYVNGRFICRGPARSAPHHQSFDTLELGPLLKKGSNALAIRVHYLRGVISYHHPGRAGLLAQLELSTGKENSTLITDSSWRVHADPAWTDLVARISRFHLEVRDIVDLRLQIRDWTSCSFKDAAWKAAQPLRRNIGWPQEPENSRPRPLTPPWTSLVPRDLPYLLETPVNALDLIEASVIPPSPQPDRDRFTPDTADFFELSYQTAQPIRMGIDDWQKGDKPLVIAPGKPKQGIFLLFDLGRLMNGRPRLDIEGPSGTTVEVMCAPYILENRFTGQIVDSSLIDTVTLSGKRDFWEALYLKPTRYLGIAIRNLEQPIRLYSAGVRRVEYPFAEKGRIRTPEDPWFEGCWEASAETIRVCTTDAFTDNYRERRQYAQTGYYAALGNYAVFGDTALQRRYLVQIAQEQQANGLMPAYAPRSGNDFMVILDSNCLWIRSLHDYLLYSGDRETTRCLLPAARQLMKFLERYTNELGLLDSPPFPYWLDHALNDRRGANFCLNGHYLGALEDFSELLTWLGEPGAQQFGDKADRLRSALQAHFWDPHRQLFTDAWIDGHRSERFSEHANAMALSERVATPEQASAVAKILLKDDDQNFIRRESGIIMVTPAMSYALHAGLCRYGYVFESLGLLKKRFRHMLRDGSNGTLWEEWWLDATGRSGVLNRGRTRSDAQTESAFPPALFREFILGVRPTRPGLEEVVVFRPNSGLKQVDGEIPSPLGNLSLRWNEKEQDRRQLEIQVPKGMLVKLDLTSLSSPDPAAIVVDGESLEGSVLSRGFLALRQGDHQIAF